MEHLPAVEKLRVQFNCANEFVGLRLMNALVAAPVITEQSITFMCSESTSSTASCINTKCTELRAPSLSVCVEEPTSQKVLSCIHLRSYTTESARCSGVEPERSLLTRPTPGVFASVTLSGRSQATEPARWLVLFHHRPVCVTSAGLRSVPISHSGGMWTVGNLTDAVLASIARRLPSVFPHLRRLELNLSHNPLIRAAGFRCLASALMGFRNRMHIRLIIFPVDGFHQTEWYTDLCMHARINQWILQVV